LGTKLGFEFAATGFESADFVGFAGDVVVFVAFWDGWFGGFFVFGGFTGLSGSVFESGCFFLFFCLFGFDACGEGVGDDKDILRVGKFKTIAELQ